MARTDNRRAPISCEGLPATRAEANKIGSKYYFSGPCKQGHMSPRITSKSECLECKRQTGKRYYRENEDKIVGRVKEWAAANPDKRRENANAFFHRHKEETADKRKSAYDRWYANNLDAARMSKRQAQSRRRSQKIGSGGSHTHDDIERIRKDQKNRCACCRTKLTGKWHIDHIKPLSKGGSDAASNIQIMCAFCNLSKKDKDPIDFMRTRGRLL